MSTPFAITEDDVNRLDAVRGQLRFVASLLLEGKKNVEFSALDMCDFVTAQADAIDGAVRNIYDQYEEEQSTGMTPFYWSQYARFMSGLEISAGAILAVSERLAAMARDDENERPVFDAWLSKLVQETEPGQAASEAPVTANATQRRTGRARALAEEGAAT